MRAGGCLPPALPNLTTLVSRFGRACGSAHGRTLGASTHPSPVIWPDQYTSSIVDGRDGVDGRSAWDALPAGKEIFGPVTFGDAVADGPEVLISQQYSFPGAAPQPLTDTQIHVVTPAGIDGDAQPGVCQGSVDAPTAPTGIVCVYLEHPVGPISAVSSDTTRYLKDRGFVLRFRVGGTTAGAVSMDGVWAYTAP